MTPEEFAAAVKKLWVGFCEGAFAAAIVLAHWLCVSAAWAWKTWSRFYTHILWLIGTVFRRGWRPYIPWCFGALLTVLVVRVALGLPLPDAMTLSVLMGPLGALTAHSVQVRSGEYRAGVANGAPTASPIEGGPRPYQPA